MIYIHFKAFLRNFLTFQCFDMSRFHGKFLFSPPFHENSIHIPYYQLCQAQLVGFIPNEPIMASYQKTYQVFHPPTLAQSSWKTSNKFQEFIAMLNQPCYLPIQSQHTDNMGISQIKRILLDFNKQLDDIKRKQELNLQQEELAYQAYQYQQDMDAHRKQYEDFLAKEISTKQEQMSLLPANVQRMEDQSTTYISNQIVKEESSRFKFPIFKKDKLLKSSRKSIEFEIPSFRSLHPMQEVMNIQVQPFVSQNQSP